MPELLTLHAHAKINLSLEILGRRPDGYHEIVSLMQTISLADKLIISPSPQLTFTCSDPALAGPDNLVLRAAQAFEIAACTPIHAAVHLEKHIPHAAGLGGGSSDAATTLLGLNTFLDAGLSPTTLHGLATSLGSDVPFFLGGGTALVEGRGERITPLPDLTPTWFVLAKPAVGLSTASVYAAINPSDFTHGTQTRGLAVDPSQFGPNGLQRAALSLGTPAADCLSTLSRLAERGAILSGSGPTSVAWFVHSDRARQAAAEMRRHGCWSEAVCSISRSEIHQ